MIITERLVHDDDWILQTLWEEINKYYFYQFVSHTFYCGIMILLERFWNTVRRIIPQKIETLVKMYFQAGELVFLGCFLVEEKDKVE